MTKPSQQSCKHRSGAARRDARLLRLLDLWFALWPGVVALCFFSWLHLVRAYPA